MDTDVKNKLALLPQKSKAELRALWQELFKNAAPSQVRGTLLIRILAYKIQEQAYGGLSTATRRRLRELAHNFQSNPNYEFAAAPQIKPGTRLLREWRGQTHHVTVLERGYEFAGRRHSSLSQIARLITGTRWSGPLFFGLKTPRSKERTDGR